MRIAPLVPRKDKPQKPKARKAAPRKERTAAPSMLSGIKARFKAWFFSWRMLGRLASVGLTMFILFLGAMIYFSATLPDISGLATVRRTPGIQVLAASGEVIGTYGQIYGEYLPYQDLPKNLVDAVIATEDRRFFSHFGIDPLGILRAMFVNMRKGGFVQGGSTITQQLAKNVFLTPDRTLARKLQEMLLAFWLEGRFSKEEILSIYLNRVYLGAGNYGVDAAARHYFGKPARELSVAESAVLAGLLKAPSRYSPASDPKLSAKRAHQVLLNMVDADMLTEQEANQAMASLSFSEQLTGGGKSERFFTDWIVDQLPEYLSHVEEDIIIRTTLELSMQVNAEAAMAAQLTDEIAQKSKAQQAALLAMRPSGAIVAMIGGRDYTQSQFNRATQAKRQPGSAFKMFIYLAAMEAGYTPDDLIEDKPITIRSYRQVWEPRNYDGKYRGEITLRAALTQSINTVAAQLIQAVTPERVVTVARRLGIRSKLVALPSLALGSSEVTLLELTGAYAHLASSGMGVQPYGIAEIRRKEDNKLLYQHPPAMSYIVVQPEKVAMMNNMLSNVIAAGTGQAAAIGRSAAGKTGTASDYKDAWFMGYTPDLVAGVWVGNDNATPMAKITGGSIPARIWKEFMGKSLEGTVASALPTTYGFSLQDYLPWGGEGSEEALRAGQPQGEEGIISPRTGHPMQRPPARPAADASSEEGKSEGGLGHAFWNTLFDDSKVEYDYPNAGR